MTDDTSLALAQAIERLIRCMVSLNNQKTNVHCAELFGKPVDVAAEKAKLPEAEAAKETAVLELAAQLAAWRAKP
jgi:hypothetical protein